jgi:hypothetical protein
MRNLTPQADIYSGHILKVLVHSGALLIAFLITWLFFPPHQKTFLLDEEIAALVFLPFGIKVISAFFEGWRSILYLAPGAAIANILFTPSSLIEPKSIAALLICYSTAPVLFASLDWMIRNDRRAIPPNRGWRHLVMVGLLASFITSTLTHSLLAADGVPPLVFQLDVLKTAIGNLIGLAAILSILNASLCRN